jgi:predicted PurR-regulated permease PerM
MKSARTESGGDNRTGQAIILFGTLAILYFARGILIPLALAVILAFFLTPAVTLLKRAGVGRVPAVIVTVLLATAVAGFMGWIIANQLVEVARLMPAYRENIHARIAALHMPTSGALAQAAESVKEIGAELSEPPATTTQQPVAVSVVAPGTTEFQYIWSLATPFLAPIGSALVVLIFAVFVMIEKEDLRDRILRLAGTGQLNVMTEAIDDAATRVSRYLLMQLTVNVSFGLLIGTGLYVIGLPNPFLWGVVAGILRIIPYAGTLIAGALPLAFSLAVFQHWSQPLMVFALFAAIELITANFLEPWLYGVHTGISSLALLVTTVFWGALWGPAGLILATPLTVCLVVLGRYIPQLVFLHILLGDEPVLAPAEQLYQRLLAMDQGAARVVVDVFMKSGPLGQLYDTVLVPALGMAEQDRHRAAIDSTREEFLFLNMNELVAEFSEQEPQPRRVANGRILCVPAHDQADEIAAAMLSQLLEHEGFVSLSFPVGDGLIETLELMQPGESDLICISALQPYAFAPARQVCKSIRARFPNTKLGAGIWGFTGDPKKAMARFDKTPPDYLFTRFADVMERVPERAQ